MIPSDNSTQQTSETMVQPPRIMHAFFICCSILFVAIGSSVGGIAVYGHMQKDLSAQGLLVGSIPVGGMTEEEVRTFVSNITTKLLSTSITVQIETSDEMITKYIDPVFFVGTEGIVQELALFDEPTMIDAIYSYGKEGNSIVRGWNLLNIRFFNPSISLPGVSVITPIAMQVLEESVDEYIVPAVNASIQITQTDPLTVRITDSSYGTQYDIPLALRQIEDMYTQLSIPEVALRSVREEPLLHSSDLQAVEETVETVLSQFPIIITYTNTSTQQSKKWTIYKERAATFLEPKGQSDSLYLGVQAERFLSYVTEVIEPQVAVDPVNARFSISNNKVEEFRAASPGIAIATTTLVAQMDAAIIARNSPNASVSSTISLDIVVVQPEISTESVNNLGITEILGIGKSNFAGSPANRIANIRNAINKLDGLIIPPGAEFSTIQHTKPYTLAGGYVPEMVIKGDSITPEIGGGLCQIGTTLFRMAMNSGLKITERRNHSLVVAYYNDLENGLPGTDATLYDPAPDFKFMNDTDNYILIETDLNMTTGILSFILWGTSDGRTAKYTPPQVIEWFNPGETRYIESKDLAPGVTQCQNAFRGASTRFTYTRTLPGASEPEQTVYTSRYRALPRICLVGAAAKVPVPVCEAGDISCGSTEATSSVNTGTSSVIESESTETVPTV
jgi:vancomycin resistance protein YoaR